MTPVYVAVAIAITAAVVSVYFERMYRGMRCEDCAFPYYAFALDVALSETDWRIVHPEGDGGVLCARCLVARASRVPGVSLIWMGLGLAYRDDNPSYWAEALDLVADQLMALKPEELDARAPKLMAVIRNAAHAMRRDSLAKEER